MTAFLEAVAALKRADLPSRPIATSRSLAPPRIDLTDQAIDYLFASIRELA